MKEQTAKTLHNIIAELEQHHPTTFKDVCCAAKVSEQELSEMKKEIALALSQTLAKFRGGWNRDAHKDFIIIFSDALRGDEDPNKDSELNALETIDKMLKYIKKYTYISTLNEFIV